MIFVFSFGFLCFSSKRHCDREEIPGEKAGGVGEQPRPGIQDCQAEEGDRPNPVEDLEKRQLERIVIKESSSSVSSIQRLWG